MSNRIMKLVSELVDSAKELRGDMMDRYRAVNAEVARVEIEFQALRADIGRYVKIVSEQGVRLAALEAAGEPVAWLTGQGYIYRNKEIALAADPNAKPIYTHPSPLVPMTKDEAEDIWNLWETGKASGHEIILAVEAHHGVKP